MTRKFKFNVLPNLGTVILLLSGLMLGLAGWQPALAQTTPTPQWQQTAFHLPNTAPGIDVGTCVDATQADTLQIEEPKPGTTDVAEAFAINWKTGARTDLNAAQFALCSASGGLLGLNRTQNVKVSDLDPNRPSSSYAYAHDGNYLFYKLAPADVQNQNGGSYLSVSKDGVNWTRRPKNFAGYLNTQLSLGVADNDSFTVYVLDCVSGAQSCVLNLSRDAGMTWQEVNNSVKPGLGTYFNMIQGHDVPYLNLSVTQSASQSFLNMSTDGGKTFKQVSTFTSSGPHGPVEYVNLYGYSNYTLRFKSHYDSDSPNYSYALDISSDGGQNWTPYNLPSDAETYPLNLTQLTYSPTSFLLSSVRSDVSTPTWFSNDFGLDWQKLPDLPASPASTPAQQFNSTPFLTPYSPASLLQFKDGQLYILDLSVLKADRNQPNPTVANLGVGVNFYKETSHNLSPLFRGYWEKYGGLAQFGFPTTELIQEVNPADNKIYFVQYFERARFESHPEFAGTPFEVELGLLGNQLTAGRRAAGEAPFNRVANPQNKEMLYFDQTGHTISNEFKTYWQQHGGLAIYGYPISEEFQEKNPDDGKTYTVQYFERNRFEYHPEFRGTQYAVLLGLLGSRVLHMTKG